MRRRRLSIASPIPVRNDDATAPVEPPDPALVRACRAFRRVRAELGIIAVADSLACSRRLSSPAEPQAASSPAGAREPRYSDWNDVSRTERGRRGTRVA